MNMRKKTNSASQKIFQLLLRAFPFDFRTNYEGEMAGMFQEQQREATQ